MNYEPVAGNTVHRRTGTIGKLMNTIKPLKHEENRKERLMTAIKIRNEDEAVRLIRDTGMKPSDFNTNTFIHEAISSGLTRVVEALIAAGANVNKVNSEGNTPLFYAIDVFNIYPFRLNIINILISAGANVNQQCGYDRLTVLHLAVKRNSVYMVQILLAAGANINIQSRDGKTPLDNSRWRVLREPDMDDNSKAQAREILHLLDPTFEPSEVAVNDKRLNIPVTNRNFNLEHAEDPITLENIKEGNEYYMMNENVNPYSKSSMNGLMKSANPRSPTTREPITKITKHKRPATTGGRTRKHRKSKRKTRCSRK